MRTGLATGLILLLAICWRPAVADDSADHALRLAAKLAGAQDPVPKLFVIDARIKPGDSEFQSEIEGWFAGVVEPAASGEVSGTCVEKHCVLTVTLDNAKLSITGDFAAPVGPGPIHFVLKDDEGKAVQSGDGMLGPLPTDPVPGLGAIAPPDAINEADLDDLLMWSHETVSSGSAPSDPFPSSYQHEAVASWQQEKGRLATGLIFAGDLEQLRADRAAAEKAAGWTPLGDGAHGWTGGYPAALLPVASQSGVERRFASADGKAVLTVAVDPPMSSEDFDALVEKISGDRPGRNAVNTTRVNGDLETRFDEKGVSTVAVYHNRDGGLARLVLTYPTSQADAFSRYEVILQRQFKVGDDLKP
jgi:hypothetical protein